MSEESEPSDLVVAGRYRNARAGRERATVVLAMHRPCWLVTEDPGAILLVRPEDSADVAEQLRRFERERRFWPPRPPPPVPAPTLARSRAARGWALGWASLEVFVYWLQQLSGAPERWGVLHRDDVFRRGQVWRPLTALFLHADPTHLLGNLTAGYFVFTLVLAAGPSLGRAALVLAGASVAGNLAAAALQGANEVSLGASTAVFAALGVLTGQAVHRAWRHDARARGVWWRVLAPLGSGAALLGLYGYGAPETDAVAHLAGFAAGLLAGFRPDSAGETA